jgi:hypothetical protein
MSTTLRGFSLAAVALVAVAVIPSPVSAQVKTADACTFGITLNGAELLPGIILLDSDQNPLALHRQEVVAGSGEKGIIILDSRPQPDRFRQCSEETLRKAAPIGDHALVSVQDLSRVTGGERAFHLERNALHTSRLTSADRARSGGTALFIRERRTISERIVRLTDGRSDLPVLPLADLTRAMAIGLPEMSYGYAGPVGDRSAGLEEDLVKRRLAEAADRRRVGDRSTDLEDDMVKRPATLELRGGTEGCTLCWSGSSGRDR